ncbi:putative rRNA maturation factor [Neisseria sp. HSC-16F19]|nr:rRNA maturation RNase YbeY [Neisseria sp. HSC-16F19]MCP2041500.1 putative rRNA maturation factor [Neisseria sp. HSC-16F19]
MKKAKRNPFLQRQRRDFTLGLDVRCDAAELPAHADFYRWAWQALKRAYRRADIGIVLCGEDEARAYNRDYRGKDYATNVLSFALNEGETVWQPQDSLNGDLVFCPAVVAREAAEQGKTVAAHYAHLTVHGVLHLMGYDHIDEAEAEAMEALETTILHQLGYANPYQEDTH